MLKILKQKKSELNGWMETFISLNAAMNIWIKHVITRTNLHMRLNSNYRAFCQFYKGKIY